MKAHEAMAESGNLQYKIRLIAAILIVAIGGVISGVIIGASIPRKHELSYTERRDISIEFMRHEQWRYALCHMPMDRIIHDEGNENGK
jgi:hypothetical protein